MDVAAVDGSGEPTTVAGVIKKADHSLQKDHLVLLQGFEIQGTVRICGALVQFSYLNE
jgi:hypothetical protein